MKSGIFNLTVFYIIIVFVIILGCSNSNSPVEPDNNNSHSIFESIGFESQYINKVTVYGEFLYAGTQSGLYKMNINDTDYTWNMVGLEQQDIKTICIINSLNIIVGVDSDGESIYRTSDGGATWDPYSNDYGNGTTYPLDIKSLDNTGQVLVSGSQGMILKSDDNGQNWNIVWNDNSLETNVFFVKQNPSNNDILWAGGQKADSSPLLLKSIDQGNNWVRTHVYRNDTTSVNICLNLEVHPDIQNIVWLLYPTMIKTTSNNGASWITALASTTDYIFDQIGIDEVNPDNLYVVNRSSLSNYLNLYKSKDGGSSWTLLSDSTYDNHPVHDMVVNNIGNTNIIYLATENGILKYTDNDITISN